MWATALSWLFGNKWKLAAAGVVVLLALGAFRFQAGRIDELTAENHNLALQRDELTAAVQGKEAVIGALEQTRALDSEAIIHKDGLIHELNQKLAAQRRQNAQAGQSDPEHRHWAAQPVSGFADRLLGGGPADSDADGDNPADPAPGAHAGMPQARLERRD